MEILFRYLHFVAIFVVVGSLVGEHLLLKPTLTRAELKRLSVVDGVYALGVVLVLAVGFTLWFGPGIGKPASYYSNNWLMWAKLSTFGAIGLLSIYPTVFFARERTNLKKGRQAHEKVALPRAVVWLVRLELLLLLLMPLWATFMAKGPWPYGLGLGWAGCSNWPSYALWTYRSAHSTATKGSCLRILSGN